MQELFELFPKPLTGNCPVLTVPGRWFFTYYLITNPADVEIGDFSLKLQTSG